MQKARHLVNAVMFSGIRSRHHMCLSETMVVVALADAVERCRTITESRIPACAPSAVDRVTLQARFDSLESNLSAIICYVKLVPKDATRFFLPGCATGKDWLKLHMESLDDLRSVLTSLRTDVLFATYFFFAVGKRLAARQPLLWKLHARTLEYAASMMRFELCGSRDERSPAWTEHFKQRLLDRLEVYDATPTATIFPQTAASSVDLAVTWLKKLYHELTRSWLCTHGLPVSDTFQCLELLGEHLDVHMPAGELMARLMCKQNDIFIE